MSSLNKQNKTDKKNHHGRGGGWLKIDDKLKRCAFYNATSRQKLEEELYQDLNDFDDSER